jgi:superfamily II DNA or RNA helicase
VGVFTTGFDCKDVETIIMNRATKSLALYIQMVGRGGRITDKIYKPSFKFIDMGGNIKRFGNWSDDRNWVQLFKDRSEKKCKIDDTLKYYECKNCEHFNLVSEDICENCGTERIIRTSRKGYLNEIAKPVKELKLPDVDKLVDFCERNNFDLAFCRREYYKAIAEMFISKGTSKEAYFNAKVSGKLTARIKNFAVPDYFIMRDSKLEGNRKRRLESFIKNIEKNIEKVYC